MLLFLWILFLETENKVSVKTTKTNVFSFFMFWNKTWTFAQHQHSTEVKCNVNVNSLPHPNPVRWLADLFTEIRCNTGVIIYWSCDYQPLKSLKRTCRTSEELHYWAATLCDLHFSFLKTGTERVYFWAYSNKNIQCLRCNFSGFLFFYYYWPGLHNPKRGLLICTKQPEEDWMDPAVFTFQPIEKPGSVAYWSPRLTSSAPKHQSVL